MLITRLLPIQIEGHQESCNEVESESLARISGIQTGPILRVFHYPVCYYPQTPNPL